MRKKILVCQINNIRIYRDDNEIPRNRYYAVGPDGTKYEEFSKLAPAKRFARETFDFTRKSKKINWKKGMRVHFDTDNYQWGRVASDGTIREVRTKSLLVDADSIMAGIIIKKSEAYPIKRSEDLRYIRPKKRKYVPPEQMPGWTPRRR